jgi:uroporphyrinogen-III synthase
VLPDGLRAAGAEVVEVTAYRNVPADVDTAALRDALVAGELHALTFTSPSTARHFAAQLDARAREAARGCWIAAIGPVTAEALRREGLEPDVMPQRASADELVSALAARIGENRDGATP